MSGGYISLYNGSSVFGDAELQSALPDFQAQVSYEFNWYWGLNAYLDINGGGTPIIIDDYPGAADPPDGYLGYHWVTRDFRPYAVVFAGLCRDYGYSVTGVISHELLEMLADQLTDTCALFDFGDGTGIIILQEVCDPCEASLYYEAPNGNIVSDFALPGWYVPGYPYQVDFLGVIPGPWQLGSGGYVSYQYVTLSGWQQAFGDKVQQDMAKAAEALRNQIAAGGNPRADLVQRLQLQGARGAEEFQPVPAGTQRGEQVPASTQRRQQAAQPAQQITVVKRQDVPKLGLPDRTPQRPAPEATQPPSQAKVAARASAKGRTGPKLQTIPDRSS
jgi:hypothetical protein